MNWRTTGHWAACGAVMAITSGLAYDFGTGIMAAVTTCHVVNDIFNVGHLQCPDTHDFPAGLATLGAIFGFWFTHTGRLVRLFRKV